MIMWHRLTQNREYILNLAACRTTTPPRTHSTQIAAAPITKPENEDPAIFRDPRGNLHLITNVNTGHSRCAANVPCGGHAWSADGLQWSDVSVGAFGPVARMQDGSTRRLGYVERPQIAQVSATG